MPTESLEQKTLDVEKILKDFRKALKKKNPEGALEYLRNVVSSAEYDGRIDQCSLIRLARETQKIVEEYHSKKQNIENNQKINYGHSEQIYSDGNLSTDNFPKKYIEN